MSKKFKKNLVNVIISNYKNLELSKVEALRKAEEKYLLAQKELEEVTAATRSLTGGYAAYELIDSKVVDTTSIDKATGRPIRKREFFLKPEMFVISEDGKEYSIVENTPSDVVNTEEAVEETTNTVSEEL